MKKRVRLSDIALELSTSKATVSRALQNHPRISDQMKKRVLAAAEKFNFRVNKVASSLRSGRTHLIGVMIPSAEINFFGSVVHGIESLANDEGYSVLIYQSNELKEFEIKGLETFLSARVDGILVSLSKQTEDFSHFLNIKNKGIPIAFFDRHQDQLGIPSVTVDDFKGAYLATSHLIAQGYKQIAHISGPLHVKIFKDRLMGYQKALSDQNMALTKSFIFQGDVSIEAGRQGVDRLLKLRKKPDAIFAVEDFTALGVIKELKNRGLRIPEQFGVIGFANEQFGQHITPSLSSVDQQTVKMGQEAFKLIREHIKSVYGKTAFKARNITLEPIPIFRESSQKKRNVSSE